MKGRTVAGKWENRPTQARNNIEQRHLELFAEILASSFYGWLGFAKTLAFFPSMNDLHAKYLKTFRALCAFAFIGVCPVAADTVVTTDGSRLQGKILKVDAGVIEIETAFAGVVKIKQASVASFATDAPINVRFKDGNTFLGTVSENSGEIRVAGGSVASSGAIGDVTAAWLPGRDSPETSAMKASRRKWRYEASLDVLGKSGNSDSLSSSVGSKATLAGPRDKLDFYAAYARAGQNNTTTVDQAKGGVDYSSNFSDKYSWYVREEIGTDKIQRLDFYSTTAAGLGFARIKKANQVLTIRSGLAYRYETHDNGNDVSSPSLDLALIHTLSPGKWKLDNRLTFLPTFGDFGTYRILHDSYYEMPLAAGFWKVRVGLANNHNSEPRPGLKNLDTTYYTKFVLGWK